MDISFSTQEAVQQLLGRAKALLDGSPTAPDTWDDRAAAWCDDYAKIEDLIHPKAESA